jgi:hypothetical protein
VDTLVARRMSYREFWPYYLKEHSKPLTRYLHYVGTALALVFFALSVYYADGRFLWAAVFSGYFFAWTAHFFVEKNKPATFQYPLYSLFSDFRLFFAWLFFHKKRI